MITDDKDLEAIEALIARALDLAKRSDAGLELLESLEELVVRCRRHIIANAERRVELVRACYDMTVRLANASDEMFRAAQSLLAIAGKTPVPDWERPAP